MSQIEMALKQFTRRRKGYKDPGRQFAVVALLRAIRDLRRGSECCPKLCSQAHRCRESALRWLTEADGLAEYFMEYLGFDQWSVMGELGLLDEHYDPTFEWGEVRNERRNILR